ncbi:hypothetical protein AAC387_Pa12g0689 [Persea americana]
MDWLAGHHATKDCFNKTITFKLDATPLEITFQGDIRKPSVNLISALKAYKLLRSGCEGYVVFIMEDKQSQGVEKIPVVCESSNVFPEEILGLPSTREIDFTIELLPWTTPTSIAPYRTAPVEVGELKVQL